ncbi:MAG: hypothetical protein M3O01_11550 [Pseudomonadota bacterium]|nr:hypothetical protein [Pseudomonadota bacterium]
MHAIESTRNEGLRAWGWAEARAWLGRAWRHVASSAESAGSRPLERQGVDEALGRLDARTLQDIGAPEHLLARAMASEEAERQDYQKMRIVVTAGVRFF